MLEKKVTLGILALGVLLGCAQKEYYIPSKIFYREGESFKQTCNIAKSQLEVYLPDICSESAVNNELFSCKGTTVKYDQILRLVLTKNDIGENALYISVADNEYVLVDEQRTRVLKEVTDSLGILKNCGGILK